jgi:serine/threonine protein kinase
VGQAVEKEFERRPLIRWNKVAKAKCVFGIAETMRFLHAQNVIHRDLKLDNVFLNADFEPVVGDFGCAKVQAIHNTVRVGSPLYIAPEVWGEEEYGPPVDVFSYAVCLRQIFEKDQRLDDGKPESKKALDYNKRVGEGARLRRTPRISDFYWNLIKLCWAQNPSERMTFAQIVGYLKEHRNEYAMTDDPVVLAQIEEYENRLCGQVRSDASHPRRGRGSAGRCESFDWGD